MLILARTLLEIIVGLWFAEALQKKKNFLFSEYNNPSDNQRSFLINCLLCADMLHTSAPVRTKKIKTQTIFVRIYCVNQSFPQSSPLRRINNTFKNRILNPLPIILTGLSDMTQTLRPSFILHRNIVTDQNKHDSSPYFQINGG